MESVKESASSAAHSAAAHSAAVHIAAVRIAAVHITAVHVAAIHVSAAHAAAIHAASASHHLIGNGVELLTVDDNGAAVELGCPVIVKGGIACDIDGAAVDYDVAVGINAVGVSGTHCDGNAAAVNLDGGSEVWRGFWRNAG